MAKETALKMSTVKVNPFKKGCNLMPNASKKKEILSGIPTLLPFPEKVKTRTPMKSRIDKIKEI